MKKKNITIDTLAGMIKRGFDNVEKRMVNKEEFNARFAEVNKRFTEVNEQFIEVNKQLSRIEKLLITDHHRRIEKLEIQVQELRELLAIK